MARLPSQKQLVFPLLDAAKRCGGRITTTEAYAVVADALQVDDEGLSETVRSGNGRTTSKFHQRLRWARHRAIELGYLRPAGRGVWEVTEAAEDKYALNKSDVVYVIFETGLGEVLWGSTERAAEMIEPGSVNLLYTSPPYPLLQPKEYGNLSSKDWVKWMLDLSALWKPLLAEDGSLVLNVGTVGVKGVPFTDTYVSRFIVGMEDHTGMNLVDEHYWHSPTKLPTPVHWVAVKGMRLKNSIEKVLWFAKSPNVKASNNNVRVPQSDKTARWRKNANANDKSKAIGKRPSGNVVGKGFLRESNTAIPSVLHVEAPQGPHSAYRVACKERGIEPHPAISPQGLPELWIKLTTETGDLVFDPFAGSLTTAVAAEKLGRRWLAVEQSAYYAAGGTLRF
ncbi:site-specific DNA-methyltransferase [Thalassospira xiamenensis]|uniref:Methyltransferase n=1 Tax=Thalassospira xiamenensis TaxID=220697 RepID=A0A285U1Q4_9PROT|nr:site-specific DNA-methyltransferase [Thalassospira xiamenensis]SOC30551.1 site-specific DNA-methyltransferase (cytosine-N4-specific) [Thalassospira xiamenensis]